MAINSVYPRTSPYYFTDIVDDKFLDIMENRTIPILPSDVAWVITPTYEYRPDLLAFDLYGTAKLWWVFPQRNPNRLKDPYFDFVTGLQIYLPRIETLKSVLGI